MNPVTYLVILSFLVLKQGSPCPYGVYKLLPNINQQCRQYFSCSFDLKWGGFYCPYGRAFSYRDQTCLPSNTFTCGN